MPGSSSGSRSFFAESVPSALWGDARPLVARRDCSASSTSVTFRFLEALVRAGARSAGVAAAGSRGCDTGSCELASVAGGC